MSQQRARFARSSDHEHVRDGGRSASGDSAQRRHASSQAFESSLPAPEGLHRFFRVHSRSFSFAARWFSTEEYRLVASVYAFCRTTDDLVDRSSESALQVRRRLDRWQALARTAYEGRSSGISWLDGLMETSAQAGVPFRLIADLIDGVRMDLGPVALPSMASLYLYTHRVASVVGMWLCYLFDARETEILRRAAVMGRAMQVTNILRDVGEDLQRQRIYLPTELMACYGVTQQELRAMASGAKPITEAYKALLEDLMERAEADYRYAFRGLTGLPLSFARASAVAAEVYRGIHRAIRRNGYDNLRHRAYTRWLDKAVLAGRGLYRLRNVRRRPCPSAARYRMDALKGPVSLFPSPDPPNVSTSA